MRIKKPYRFALVSAAYITLITTILTLLYCFLFDKKNITFLQIIFIVFVILVFLISFLIIQFRAQKFIYKRIKSIYDEIGFLDTSDLKKLISTDVDELSKSVQNYVEDKKLEIESLTERDSYRRDFLGNVAHELKTPLFTVQGYILTLLEGAVNDKMIRDKYLERANKGVERLISIVKDLDMISKLETEGMKMNIEVFNILEVIQNVFDLFEMRAKKRDITLQFDKIYDFPFFVEGDLARIEQVLINLVVNSIKYGSVGGVTTIRIDSYNQNKFIVRVIDNGEGIKEEHVSRLFERFYRVDQSRSREQGGSGLGLSIVKHIVEAHNETILLKSIYGEGSEFSFTIEKAQ